MANPKSLVTSSGDNPIETRDVRKWNGHFMRGGKLTLINSEIVREKEGGVYTALINQELAPMPVRLLNNIRCGVISVYVPVPSMLNQRDGDTEDMAGTAEYARRKLTSGASVFGLQTVSADADKIYNTARVVPRPVGGVPKVSDALQYAHAAAVNYLRRRVYVDALTVPKGQGLDETSPTIYSKSSLQILNGVLDPDDRINGEIDFTGEIPVKGIGLMSSANGANGDTVKETGGGEVTYTNAENPSNDVRIETDDGVWPQPNVRADMSEASGISLRDFYQSEEKERGARILRKIIDENPEYGEEMALNWAHGLSVEVGDQPFILYENETDFASQFQTGTESDGIYDGGTKGISSLSHSVPVPQTEFGGYILTFTYVKPDEVLELQPDPFQTETWEAQNFLEERLIVDPESVTASQLDASVAQGDEDEVMMYVGHNGLKRSYRTGGWSFSTDLDNVAEKSSLWQISVPTSVSPENVIYPDTVDHYPFADQNGHAVTVFARTELKMRTPMVFGPAPVETVGIIEDGEIYGDA